MNLKQITALSLNMMQCYFAFWQRLWWNNIKPKVCGLGYTNFGISSCFQVSNCGKQERVVTFNF